MSYNLSQSTAFSLANVLTVLQKQRKRCCSTLAESATSKASHIFALEQTSNSDTVSETTRLHHESPTYTSVSGSGVLRHSHASRSDDILSSHVRKYYSNSSSRHDRRAPYFSIYACRVQQRTHWRRPRLHQSADIDCKFITNSVDKLLQLYHWR